MIYRFLRKMSAVQTPRQLELSQQWWSEHKPDAHVAETEHVAPEAPKHAPTASQTLLLPAHGGDALAQQ